jgi:hypothetical protein
MEIKMTMKEYNSVKETLERLLPEDSKLRSRILSEFYEANRRAEAALALARAGRQCGGMSAASVSRH